MHNNLIFRTKICKSDSFSPETVFQLNISSTNTVTPLIYSKAGNRLMFFFSSPTTFLSSLAVYHRKGIIKSPTMSLSYPCFPFQIILVNILHNSVALEPKKNLRDSCMSILFFLYSHLAGGMKSVLFKKHFP